MQLAGKYYKTLGPRVSERNIFVEKKRMVTRKTLVTLFLVCLAGLVLGLGIYAVLRTKEKTQRDAHLNEFLNAPVINRSQIVGSTGTWSLNATRFALELIWTSNSQNYTVWDTINGVCGVNSLSYARLSNTAWFDSDNFVPEGLGFASSFSVLASTPLFTNTLNQNNYSFNLVLYPGMLRIEQDGDSYGVWNNYQGSVGMPQFPVWPSTQDAGDSVLWQLGNVFNAAQFRSNGQLLVGNPLNPYALMGEAKESWFAENFSFDSC